MVSRSTAAMRRISSHRGKQFGQTLLPSALPRSADKVEMEYSPSIRRKWHPLKKKPRSLAAPGFFVLIAKDQNL